MAPVRASMAKMTSYENFDDRIWLRSHLKRILTNTRESEIPMAKKEHFVLEIGPAGFLGQRKRIVLVRSGELWSHFRNSGNIKRLQGHIPHREVK